MNKFYGAIGFSIEEETRPGIWKPGIQEKMYYGDVNSTKRRWSQTESPNGEVQINNEFSIISDYFLKENLSNLVYIVWHGNKWRVTSIQDQYPRIILTIGGIYHGGQNITT